MCLSFHFVWGTNLKIFVFWVIYISWYHWCHLSISLPCLLFSCAYLQWSTVGPIRVYPLMVRTSQAQQCRVLLLSCPLTAPNVKLGSGEGCHCLSSSGFLFSLHMCVCDGPEQLVLTSWLVQSSLLSLHSMLSSPQRGREELQKWSRGSVLL